MECLEKKSVTVKQLFDYLRTEEYRMLVKSTLVHVHSLYHKCTCTVHIRLYMYSTYMYTIIRTNCTCTCTSTHTIIHVHVQVHIQLYMYMYMYSTYMYTMNALKCRTLAKKMLL